MTSDKVSDEIWEGRVLVGFSSDTKRLYDMLRAARFPFLVTRSASLAAPELEVGGQVFRGFEEISGFLSKRTTAAGSTSD